MKERNYKVNKAELITKVQENIDINVSKKDLATIIDGMTTTIINTVASGEKVALAGFGNFEIAERAARTGRNPKTGEPLEIAASKSPKFHALTGFKNAVKNA